jgi:hypothetical protein
VPYCDRYERRALLPDDPTVKRLECTYYETEELASNRQRLRCIDRYREDPAEEGGEFGGIISKYIWLC